MTEVERADWVNVYRKILPGMGIPMEKYYCFLLVIDDEVIGLPRMMQMLPWRMSWKLWVISE